MRPTKSPWVPCIVYTPEEQAKFERLRAGRFAYYVDDEGWPIPPAEESR